MFESLFVLCLVAASGADYASINLPSEHLSAFFSNNEALRDECLEDEDCPYKDYIEETKCWGYEDKCEEERKYLRPECPGDHRGWVKTKADQGRTFDTQADFGYVKQQMKEMMVLCEPMFPDDSSLECSEHLRFCRGRNLMMNFTALAQRDEPLRYKMDVLKMGEIGGYCDLYQERLNENLDHMSPLQSWAPEMRFFTRLNERPIVEGSCDVVIEKPTFIMKIDAIVNMYHHFCDFFNLYASQHLNATEAGAFSTDIHILVWETFNYQSAFEATFEAFTENPVWDLKTFRGRTVCFKNIIFPLLPRMIFGLYYNTPIIYGCQNSGLFNAFSKHVLHRLRIPQVKRTDAKVKITLLSRDTKYRKILNEAELVEALERNEEYSVERVVFNKEISFKKQLEVIKNSDVLIGIHGAGLTHALFLPDWAAVFELYNCEDANCYMDLTRLRGLKYVTWEDDSKLFAEDEGTHPEGGAHAKFTNYSFDVDEFARLVAKAADYVKKHPGFVESLEGVEYSSVGSAEPIEYDESYDFDLRDEL